MEKYESNLGNENLFQSAINLCACLKKIIIITHTRSVKISDVFDTDKSKLKIILIK